MSRFIVISTFVLFCVPIFAQAQQTSKLINQVNTNGKPEGLWRFYNEKGQLFLQGNYENGKPTDTLSFFKKGKLFFKLLELENNKLLYILAKRNKQVIRSKEDDKYVYRVKNGATYHKSEQFKEYYESQAMYPGGKDAFLKFQSANLRYPKSALENKIKGIVTVSFVISYDGSVENITIVKGLSEDCNNEVTRMLKTMPKWQPGLQRGYPIKSRMNLNITFNQ